MINKKIIIPIYLFPLLVINYIYNVANIKIGVPATDLIKGHAGNVLFDPKKIEMCSWKLSNGQ